MYMRYGYIPGPVILAAVAERWWQWNSPYLFQRARYVPWEGYSVCLIHIVYIIEVMSTKSTSPVKREYFIFFTISLKKLLPFGWDYYHVHAKEWNQPTI